MALNGSMQAALYDGDPYNVTIGSVARPSIINHTDAIVRITTSALCGSDLHRYHGFVGRTDNREHVLGHEAIGWVSDVGSGISSLNVGDYVVIPFSVDSGHLEPYEEYNLPYGAGNDLGGLQTEYARVPFADHTLIQVPLSRENTTAQLEEDYLAISDILPTGWMALDYASFEPGDTVAVFGVGPVGLMAIYAAFIRGASKVYAIDQHDDRLELAESMGAIPINFRYSDPVQEIMAYEPTGVRRSLDCVGMESVGSDGDIDNGIVLRQAIEITGYRGGIGVVGVYLASNATAGNPRGNELPQSLTLPFTQMFRKGLTMGTGVVDTKPLAGPFVEIIAASIELPDSMGRPLRPSFLTSARIGVDEVPEYYERFSNASVGKVYIQFP